jgi:N-ethylmaleimide reductase
MGNDGFDPDSAFEAIKNKELDLVSFGKLAISNPDLPARIANGWELDRTMDFATYFCPGEKGYTDYPNYEPKKEEEKKEEAEEKKSEAA